MSGNALLHNLKRIHELRTIETLANAISQRKSGFITALTSASSGSQSLFTLPETKDYDKLDFGEDPVCFW